MTEDLIVPGDNAGQLVRKEQGGQMVQRATATQAYVAIEAAKQKASMQARHELAKLCPRDEDQFRADLMADAQVPAFAAEALYRKPIGGRTITGISTVGAQAVADHYGNLEELVRVISDTSEDRVIKVEVNDIQRLIYRSQEIVVTKTVERSSLKPGQEALSSRINSNGQSVYLVAATEDDLLVKQGAQVSKAKRNLRLEYLKAALKAEFIAKIHETLSREDAKDPDAQRKKVVDSFAALGVKPIELKTYLGHELDKIGPQQLAELRAIYEGLRDGEVTWPEIMATRGGAEGDKPAGDPPKTLDDLLKRKEQTP